MGLIANLKSKFKTKAKKKVKTKVKTKVSNKLSNMSVEDSNNESPETSATTKNSVKTDKPEKTASNESNGKIRKFIAARVIDGDTFQTDTGERVRLIGLDAAEIGEPGADEATEFLRVLIAGKPVWLEPDGNEKDRWGRYRSYVWVEKPKDVNDETEIRKNQVNAKILEAGHAEVRILGQVRHEELFNRIAKKK